MSHVMMMTSSSPEGWTAECPDCGMVQIVYRDRERPPELLIRGDDAVTHTWSSTPAVSLSASPAQNPEEEI